MKIKGCKKASFLEQAIKNGGQAIFYVLRCYDKDEEFYKVRNHYEPYFNQVWLSPFNALFLGNITRTPCFSRRDIRYGSTVQNRNGRLPL